MTLMCHSTARRIRWAKQYSASYVHVPFLGASLWVFPTNYELWISIDRFWSANRFSRAEKEDNLWFDKRRKSQSCVTAYWRSCHNSSCPTKARWKRTLNNAPSVNSYYRQKITLKLSQWGPATYNFNSICPPCVMRFGGNLIALESIDVQLKLRPLIIYYCLFPAFVITRASRQKMPISTQTEKTTAFWSSLFAELILAVNLCSVPHLCQWNSRLKLTLLSKSGSHTTIHLVPSSRRLFLCSFNSHVQKTIFCLQQGKLPPNLANWLSLLTVYRQYHFRETLSMCFSPLWWIGGCDMQTSHSLLLFT